MLRPLAALTALLIVPACALQGDVSKLFLKPAPQWLVEPDELGIANVPFEVPVGEVATVHGWLMTHPQSRGRTVVLFHGGRMNVSMLHPYYEWLHAAGLNVVVFDYRGFGRSKGEPSIRGTIRDMEPFFAWLRQRPEVDVQKLCFYGLSLGSVVALHAATHYQAPACLVLENVPSPRDNIRTGGDAGGESLPMLTAGVAEFATMPEDIEPDENSVKLQVPGLYILGAEEPLHDRKSLLRTFLLHKGRKQLWALPDTRHAPNSLLTHDGQYQKVVVGFVRTALEGAVERVQVEWRETAAPADGGGVYELTLTRDGGDAAVPWAVRACAVDADAVCHFQDVWLEGRTTTARLKLPGRPGAASAMRIHDVLGTEDGGFVPQTTRFCRSGRIYEELEPDLAIVRKKPVSPAEAQRIGARIVAAGEREAFDPRLEAQLADVFGALGRDLVASNDAAERASGITWLKRAIAAVPAKPNQHWWPYPPYTSGFPHTDAIDAARRLLQGIEGR